MGILEEVCFGLEAIAPDGVQKVEKEYEIYGRMMDIGLLGSALRSELQEQWGLPIDKVPANAASGSIRVRMIDNDKYVFTSKVKTQTENEEVEFDSSEDLFIHFKKFATQGLRKVRHFFPVEGTDFIYEVDAFYGPSGTFCPWVKIDLELNETVTIDNLPDFPFEMEDIRIIPPGRKSPEDLAFVRELFDKHFNLHNQFIEPPAPVVEVTSMEQSKSVMERLIELANTALDIEGHLTANGTDAEARVKFALEELALVITVLTKEQKPSSEGDHEFR